MSSTGLLTESRIPAPFSCACGILLILTLAVVGSSAPAEAQSESLSLVKSGTLDAGADGIATPGDEINYTLTAGNLQSGTECAEITSLQVTDPLVDPITCAANVIPPMGSVECTGSYAITQEDIDRGFVYNLASASGTSGCGEFSVMATAEHQENIEQVAAITLDKSGTLDLGGDGTATPLDVINYLLVVTNTGNVTLANATLSDPDLASFTCPGGHPIATLAPTASVNCTGTYEITQDDIDAGFKDNTAEITADEPMVEQTPPTTTRRANNQSTTRVMIPQQAVIALDKTGTLDTGGDGIADPGDLINYSFGVSNQGNITLSNVLVSDPMVTPISCPGGNPILTLAPATAVLCTGSYALQPADITAGSVLNNATASGFDSMMQPVSAGDSDTVMLPVPMPSTPPLGLLLLASALLATGAYALRKRTSTR